MLEVEDKDRENGEQGPETRDLKGDSMGPENCLCTKGEPGVRSQGWSPSTLEDIYQEEKAQFGKGE